LALFVRPVCDTRRGLGLRFCVVGGEDFSRLPRRPQGAFVFSDKKGVYLDTMLANGTSIRILSGVLGGLILNQIAEFLLDCRSLHEHNYPSFAFPSSSYRGGRNVHSLRRKISAPRT
jgi:hypothetical protein